MHDSSAVLERGFKSSARTNHHCSARSVRCLHLLRSAPGQPAQVDAADFSLQPLRRFSSLSQPLRSTSDRSRCEVSAGVALVCGFGDRDARRTLRRCRAHRPPSAVRQHRHDGVCVVDHRGCRHLCHRCSRRPGDPEPRALRACGSRHPHTLLAHPGDVLRCHVPLGVPGAPFPPPVSGGAARQDGGDQEHAAGADLLDRA
mmetsp:Transcript_62194/g.146185  ORF Transcript_62194/g.146185 Transcript_62194/m.146185 type:complete len:201 (+) Transcript_62194:259-861(+)